jgi:glucokinase
LRLTERGIVTRIVAADIGGTHARFAIAELVEGRRPKLGPMSRYRTGEHQGFASAWRAFKRDQGGRLPGAASLGLAGPVDGGPIQFMNSPWVVDPRTIGDELRLERVTLLNDYGAVAHAVSILGSDELDPVGGPKGDLPDEGVTTVLGPGTGLGIAMLVRRRERIEVVETEASHIGFAPLNEDEQAIAGELAGRYGRASVERIVSGPGLIDLYRHFGGGEWDVGDSGGLWSAAIQGGDPLAALALDAFVKCFGSAAGDIALAHGANAMVITGGLANRIADRLRSPLFRGRFIAKGRYRERMERVRVRLATIAEPGLLGAAVAFQREWLA